MALDGDPWRFGFTLLLAPITSAGMLLTNGCRSHWRVFGGGCLIFDNILSKADFPNPASTRYH
jgi:hypothetical protein